MTGGPTNPDKIKNVIDDGAGHDADHLLVDDQPRWLRIDNGAWELADTVATGISRETWSDIKAATPEGAFLRVGGVLKRLDEVTVDGKLVAVLNPA